MDGSRTDNITLLSSDWTSAPIINRSNDTTIKSAVVSRNDSNSIKSALQHGFSQANTPKQYTYKITNLVLPPNSKPQSPKTASYVISPYTSPKKIQSPDLNQSLPPDVINSTMTQPPNDFAAKKMDRDKCIEDFRYYLDETLTVQTKNLAPVKALPIAFKTRSKENLLNTASKGARPPLDKSKALRASNEKLSTPRRTQAVVEKVQKKEKSYDPKVAQEFMKQQQEKRKLAAKPNSVTVSREVIKQRLADLQKNTLKIVSNNVKKTVTSTKVNGVTKTPVKRSTTTPQSRPKSLPVSRRSSVKKEDKEKALSRQTSTHSLKESDPPMVVTDNEIQKMQQILSDLEQKRNAIVKEIPVQTTTSKSTFNEVSKRSAGPQITPDLTQKMGILRKPDYTTLETPISPLKLPKYLPSTSRKQVDEILDETIPYREFSFNDDKDLDLKIPDVKLQSTTIGQHSKSSNQDQSTFSRRQRANVPYWLQQTAIQPYPYNFITAVRKKLQAVVNAEHRTVDKHVQTSTNGMYQETPKAKRTGVTNAQKRKLNMREMSKSLSEMNTNMSSISLPLSELNTVSEISSIKSEVRQVHGAQTYSSSFPSNTETSPESNKQVSFISPIASQNVAGQRKSTTFIVNDGKLVVDSPTLEGSQVEDKKDDATKVNDLEYQKLLETFNKNLSMVVEVHQQLYSAFQRPATEQPQLRSTVTQTTPPLADSVRSKLTGYDEDFESRDTTQPDETATQPATTMSSVQTENAATNSSYSVQTKINESLGPASDEKKTFSFSYSEVATDPSIEATKKHAESDKENNPNAAGANTTMGSDIFAYFNQSDIEVSYTSAGEASNMSTKTNISYSSIGMVEQMIQLETSKSDQLGTLIKVREKALIDRTKGQIAWLELQKQRCKAKGEAMQITAIKKKQRAVLVRLQKEREAIQKSVRQDTVEAAMATTNRLKLEEFDSSTISLRKTFVPRTKGEKMAAMKVYEFQANDELERILRKRETELKKRRDYVERLLEWHDKLNREEDEILKLEQNLLTYNAAQAHTSPLAIDSTALENVGVIDQRTRKTAKKLRQIEKSLHELQNISTSNASINGSATEDDVVEMLGAKLNKLWHRLTGSVLPKYEAGKRYQFDKAALEELYEDAKRHVLANFQANEDAAQLKRLFGTSVEQPTPPPVENIFDDSASSNKNLSIAQLNIASSEQVFSSPEKLPAEPRSDLQASSFEPDEMMSVEISEAAVQSSEFETQNYQSESVAEEIFVQEPDEKVPAILTGETGDEVSSLDDPKSLEDNTFERSIDDDSIEVAVGARKSLSPIGDQQLIDNISFPSFFETTTNNVSISPSACPPQVAPIADDNECVATSVVSTEEFDKTTNDSDNILSAAHSCGNDDDPVSDPQPARAIRTPNASYDCSEQSIEFEEITEEDKVSTGSTNSELEKRLMTLNDSLEELSEIFSQQQQKLRPQSPVKMSPESASAPLTAMSSFLSDALRSYSQDFDTQDKTVVTEEEDDDDAKTLTPEKDVAVPLKATLPPTAPSASNSISVIVRREELSFVPIAAVASTSAKTETAGASVVPTKAVNRIMPDIINEAEVLRRQQLQIEQEIKQLEVVLMREIPNKPPPPYIPPSQNNPLSLIYPSTQRINDLICDTVKELYNNDGLVTKPTSTVSPPTTSSTKSSKFSENIINTYEKIILDLCREFYVSFKQPASNISFMRHKNYKNPLAFYNPPNDLECLQEHIGRRIKRILNIPNIDFSQPASSNSSMDNTSSSPYDSYFINNFSAIRPQHVGAFSGLGIMKKRDHVDEILVVEMLEEEIAWTNFDKEEIEVKNDVTNEIMQMLVEEALQDLESAYNLKQISSSCHRVPEVKDD